MLPNRISNFSALVILAGVLLAGCLLGGDKTTKRGSEIGNELGVGQVFLADGIPAVGARVRFYSVDHVPQPGGLPKRAGIVFEARTDEEGRYRADSLPNGEYNILGDLDGAVSFSDSVLIMGARPALPTDTLLVPGTVSGRVLMQPKDDPRSATVQVLGTNVFANLDEDGAFTLPSLADGRYNVRILTTLDEYTPLYAGIRVRSGISDTLPDPFTLIFTGIPVVTGLKASFDTLNQTVTVRWNSVGYRQLEDYLVYRTPAFLLDGAAELVGRVKDTIFTDRMPPGFFDTQADAYEYRVRIRNKSDQVGFSHGFVTVETPTRDLLATRIRLSFPGGNNHAGIGDSLVVDLRYSNSARRLRKVEWFVSGTEAAVASRTDSSFEGGDRFMLVRQDPGEVVVKVRIWDEGGDEWTDSVLVRIHLDAPVADAGRDTVVIPGSIFRLEGTAADRYGRIEKMEWDIGGTGRFFEVKGGDTAVIAPSVPDDGFLSVLRVTDNRGLIGLDTVRIFVVPVRHLGMPEPLFSGKAFGNQIVFSTLKEKTHHFDLSENRFVPGPDLSNGAPNILYRFEILDGKLHAFIRRPPNYSFDRSTVEVLNAPGSWDKAGNHSHFWNHSFIKDAQGASAWHLDLERNILHKWSTDDVKESFPGPAIPVSGPIMQPEKSQPTPTWAGRILGETFYVAYGRVWDQDRNLVGAFDIRTGQWASKSPRPRALPIHADFAVGSRWYVLAEDGRLDAYDPAADQWEAKAAIPQFDHPYRENGYPVYFAVFGQNAWLFTKSGSYIRIWRYDIAADAWTRSSRFLSEPGVFEVIQAESRMFILSGKSFMEYLGE